LRFAAVVALIVVVAVSGCSTVPGRARIAPQGDPFVSKAMKVDGEERRYAIYVPENYDPHRKWPVIVFLHGASRRGDDGVDQTRQGLGPAIMQHPERFPCIVVMPQCPRGKKWPEVSHHIETALAHTTNEFNVDSDRVYLTGLSMGGFGTFYYGSDYAHRYAAMVAIAGGARERVVDPLSTTPVWIFHNQGDTIVPVSRSRAMAQALERVGAPVQYTEYPVRGHDAWTRTYNDPEVIQWLLSQRRG